MSQQEWNRVKQISYITKHTGACSLDGLTARDAEKLSLFILRAVALETPAIARIDAEEIGVKLKP